MDYELYPLECEELCRSLGLERYITADARKQIPDEDFAWPDAPGGPKYPCDTQEHVNSCAKLLGHAPEDKQSAIKERAIKIAKRHNFSIPDSWQEEDTKERAENSEYHALYMPALPRRNADDWIVEGQATAEVPDSFGTIFTYEASKGAFERWLAKYANVREMHGKTAAGKGIWVTPDDQNKRILVGTRVSKGAPDTWTKWQEGVLNGFSVGATDVKMGRMQYKGKWYPAITYYDLAELSYVDAPSCPGSNASVFARADGMLSEIIDDSEPEQSPQTTTTQESELERAGKTISGPTQGSIHKAIGHGLRSAKAMMDTCGCDTCTKASSAIDPDNDGDVDWLSMDDTDGDSEQMTERMQGIMQGTLERSLSPVYQRQQLFLARLAQFDTNSAAILQQLEELKTLQGRLSQLDEIKAVLERMGSSTTLDEVRADLAAVKDQVKQIADQPAPGGPVLNGARPYDKSSPYQRQAPDSNREQIEQETIERLSAGGAFRTMEDQVAAAAMLLRPVRMG